MPPSFTFVDLFAGIGGFHAALSALGGQGVCAAEIDEAAAAIYEHNWKLKPEPDVLDLAADPATRVPEHVVLAGGFPCQPFSKSGTQLGMNDRRGQLFLEVLKILQEHRPPAVFLENVRNIASHDQRRTWARIVAGLRDTGYAVPDAPCVFSPHLLPPHLGGRPQVRDRVYILGTYVGDRAWELSKGLEPAVPRRPVDGWDPKKWDLERDVLVPDREIHNRSAYRLTTEEAEWIAVWNDLLRRLGPVSLPGHPLWSIYWSEEAVVDPGAPPWKQDLERKNIAFYLAHRSAVRAWLKANPQLRSFPSSRQKLEWQAQDTARDLRLCLVHFRPSGIRVKKPTYAPALVAMAQTPVFAPRQRRIVPREAARLQGFPDWFDFQCQRDGLTYKQLGNAINVGAAYYVFRKHVERHAELLVESQDRGAAPGGCDVVDAVLGAPMAPVLDRVVSPSSPLNAPASSEARRKT